MRTHIKRLLKRALSRTRAGKTLIALPKLLKQAVLRTRAGETLIALPKLRPFLDQLGWLRSFREGSSVDQAGNCLPWFTYPAITFLSKRTAPGMTVFEYGSGNSTFWWSRRVSRVISCEHELYWYQSLKGRLPSNVEYLHHELVHGGEYSKTILRYNNAFDIIVIDGRDRVNCARNCLGALKDNGVVIWDNSDRDKYEEGYAYLVQNGFNRLDFDGLGPINCDGWRTSVFYRQNNCLGI